jgi:hypothetical protein
MKPPAIRLFHLRKPEDRAIQLKIKYIKPPNTDLSACEVFIVQMNLRKLPYEKK